MQNNNNFKNGYNIRSKFWQDYKKSICDLSPQLFNIAIGCMLGNPKVHIRYYNTSNNMDLGIKKRLTKLERSQFNLTPE